MVRKLIIYVLTLDYKNFNVRVNIFPTEEEIKDLSKYNLTLDEAWAYADDLCEKEHVVDVFEGS